MRNWVLLLVLVNIFIVYCGAANATGPERPGIHVPTDTDNPMDANHNHRDHHDHDDNNNNILDGEQNTTWGAVVVTVIMVIIVVLALCACAQWGGGCDTYTGGWPGYRYRRASSSDGSNRNVMNGVKIVCGDDQRGGDDQRCYTGGYPPGCCNPGGAGYPPGCGNPGGAGYAPRGCYPQGYPQGCGQAGETQPLVFAVQGGGGSW